MKTINIVKQFWDRRPCNIKHSQKAFMSKEYFEEIAHKRYFVEPHIPAFAQFDNWSNKKVLEIGCGIGTDTINFAKTGASVTAVDLSEVSLEIAKKRALLYNVHKNINFIHGSAEELDSLITISPTFDLIYSFGAIHHTPHPENIIKWFPFLLNKNGQTRVMLYHRYSWKVFKILVSYGKCRFWNLDSLVSQHSESQIGCPVTYTYSKRRAKQLFRKYGIETDIQIRHIFPYKIPEYINNEYRKTWYIKHIPKNVFNLLQRKIGWHLLIKGHA